MGKRKELKDTDVSMEGADPTAGGEESDEVRTEPRRNSIVRSYTNEPDLTRIWTW